MGEEGNTLPGTEHEEQFGGPMFEPKLYIQRYYYVAQQLEKYDVKSVVDFGSAELKISRFLVQVKNVKDIALVDLDGPLLSSKKHAIQPFAMNYSSGKHVPVNIKVYQGSVTDLDKNIVGFDAVTMVEIIEHLQPDVLASAVKMVFGNLQPRVVVMTTPNSDYNVLFPGFSGFRHWDHKFEWNQQEFKHWCANIAGSYGYHVEHGGVGEPPPDSEDLGFCSQAAIFVREGDYVPPPSTAVTQSYVLIAESFYPAKMVTSLPVDEQILMEIRYVIRQYQTGLRHIKTCVRDEHGGHPDTVCVKDSTAGYQNDDNHSDNSAIRCNAGNQDDDRHINSSVTECEARNRDDEKHIGVDTGLVKSKLMHPVSKKDTSVKSDVESNPNRIEQTKAFPMDCAENQTKGIYCDTGLFNDDAKNHDMGKHGDLCILQQNRYSGTNNSNQSSECESTGSVDWKQNMCNFDSCAVDTTTVKHNVWENNTENISQIDTAVKLDTENERTRLADRERNVCNFDSCIDCQHARYQLSYEEYLVPVSSLLQNKTIAYLWHQKDDFRDFLQNHGFRLTGDDLHVIMTLDDEQDGFDVGDAENEVSYAEDVHNDRNIVESPADKFYLETESWD